jgi:site-specific DNA recombinase
VLSVPTCDIYIRLSDARIEEAFEGRETKLRSFATVLGWTVHRVVVENDIYPDGRPKPASAWKRRKIRTPSGKVDYRVLRPGFRSVLDDLATGQTNALIGEDLDRIVRDPRDMEDLLDICALTKSSVKSISGSLKITDGGDENERYIARIMVAGASKSSGDTSRRVADSRERMNGKSYAGGPRPYGFVAAQDTEKYQRTLIIVPDEQDVILAATDDILNKDISLRAIARDLCKRGIPGTKGNVNWTARTVKEVLTKPAVAGLAVNNGELKPAPWDHILERDVWEKLTTKLNDASRRTSDRGNEPRHLASGIALCGKCQNGTTVRASGRIGRTFYTCRAQYHLKRQSRDVDAWIERNITAYLSRYGVDILKPEPKKDINATGLRAEADKLRERKTAQMRMHALGQIDDFDLEIGMRTIRERLAVIDSQLAHSDDPDPIPEFRHHGPTRKIWRSLSLPRQRAIIGRVAEITILPSALRGRAGFDPDSVRIVVKKTGDVLDVRQWPDTEKDQQS